MADNTTLAAASGGDVIASDDIGGVKFQRVKLVYGADGVNAGDVATTNPLPVSDAASGIASTANSTAVNLAAAGVFTGTAEDVGPFSTIMVSVFSSHASAADGLQLQQSSDGTNWDFVDSYFIPAATGKVFSVGVQARFFRLVYTNGATATTALRIQTLVSKYAKKFSSIRPQDGRTNDNDYEEFLSYGMVFNQAAGTWERQRIQTTILWVTVTAASAIAATASLPAAGAGLFHYITSIDIQLYATAARTGSATPVLVTSTNMPGSPVWNFPTAQAIGAIDRYAVPLLTPLKSSAANTATTIAAPIATAGIWRINVGYYVGP